VGNNCGKQQQHSASGKCENAWRKARQEQPKVNFSYLWELLDCSCTFPVVVGKKKKTKIKTKNHSCSW